MILNTPADALRNRMEALHLRHAIAFPDHTPPKGALIDAFAEEISERLKRSDELAVMIARALIDEADLTPDSAFWSRPLGRLLFAAGGYRHEAISQATAASVLGLSRQRVHQLVMSGQLRSEANVHTTARAVHAGDVRDALKARLDTFVKYV